MARVVYLSLGSNLGDRKFNLRAALRSLDGLGTVDSVSSLYETEPQGERDQPLFLNLVCELQTDLSPHALLQEVKSLEGGLGRTATYRWGPRLIDIDLLLYEDKLIRDDDLVLPHPEMTRRAFVLVPLQEIAPDLRHPSTDETIRELAEGIGNDQGIRKLASISP